MTERQQPLVSVVTPVFNGETYLARVYRQCSGPDVPEYRIHHREQLQHGPIASDRDELREQGQPRIRVHRNEKFVGVIDNHNIAFGLISPEAKYCKVVSADDFIFPECIELMVELADTHPSVAIVQAYRLRGNRVAGDGLPYPSTVVPGRDVSPLAPARTIVDFRAPTTLMYRSDIVRSRPSFYDESDLAADTEVCLEFLGDRDYGFVHQVLSFHRLRRASTTGDRQIAPRRSAMPPLRAHHVRAAVPRTGGAGASHS